MSEKPPSIDRDDTPDGTVSPEEDSPPAPGGDGWSPWPGNGSGQHTVTGDVRVLRDVAGPRPQDRRNVWIWLPPSVEDEPGADRRHPVFYLQDGQNLFDDVTSFVGEWGVDEVMQDRAGTGSEAIVVGVSNIDGRRHLEYTARPDPKHGGGRAEAYLDFLVETVKARVDRDFPTLPGPEHTGIGGSSLGGVLALHGFLTRPDVFGMALVMSPALWYARKAPLRQAARSASGRGRIYLDVGTAEGWRAVRNVRKLRRVLVRSGYEEGRDLRHVEEEGAHHHERAWGRRFGPALDFLLEPRARGS